MEITVHVHIHHHHHGGAQLDTQAVLHAIHSLKEVIMSALTDLQASVTAENTVIDSAVTLLQGLKALLDAAIASGDPAALTALSADIGAKTKVLSDAVVANTPATSADATRNR